MRLEREERRREEAQRHAPADEDQADDHADHEQRIAERRQRCGVLLVDGRDGRALLEELGPREEWEGADQGDGGDGETAELPIGQQRRDAVGLRQRGERPDTHDRQAGEGDVRARRRDALEDGK